ncbi:MAG TPA: hypothetical protein VJI98_05200 [Candidatus Nanoarchaeia archaeon]|nr:hypothetical protein [Candidatus Nanoarchaeia archaeon]
MKITIKPEVFKGFHNDLKLALIFVTELDNKTKLDESKHLLKEVENLERLTFHKNKKEFHHMISPWNLAKLRFGKKAHHYSTSLENLLKLVLKGKTVSANNVLTNVMRYIALRYLIPFGADDFQVITGDLVFDIVKSNARKGILGNLKKGDLYYADQKSVLGTKLDHWKNQRTELNLKSGSALVHIEALPPITKKQLKQIVKEAASIIESFCGAKTKVFILDKKTRTITL